MYSLRLQQVVKLILNSFIKVFFYKAYRHFSSRFCRVESCELPRGIEYHS
jgi:hypothetical protein